MPIRLEKGELPSSEITTIGNRNLGEPNQPKADAAVIWLDDRDGRIVDELEVETRIRSGEGGFQLCRESLDGSEAHGEVQFDEHGLPRLLSPPLTMGFDRP